MEQTPMREQRSQWQEKIRVLYKETELSESKASAIRAALRNAPAPSTSQKPIPGGLLLVARNLASIHRSGFGYFLTAACAAALTFAVVNWNDSSADALDEVLATGTSYPPDFDLEGDANSFQEVMKELLPSNVFNPQIPSLIRQNYSPADGRLFSWRGESGVRISLQKTMAKGKTRKQKDTLFIVSLNDRNTKKFPTDKTSKKIASKSGKEKMVQTWREGRYGYALVQYVASYDDPSYSDESPQ